VVESHMLGGGDDQTFGRRRSNIAAGFVRLGRGDAPIWLRYRVHPPPIVKDVPLL